jgi:hypothetical protein
MPEDRHLSAQPILQLQRIHLSDLSDVPTFSKLRGTDIMEAFLL